MNEEKCKELSRLQMIERTVRIEYVDPEFDWENASYEEDRENMTEESAEALDKASSDITMHLKGCKLCAILSPEAVANAKKRMLEEK